MRITARPAGTDDIAGLEELYRELEDEMAALHPMWPIADGLAEPASEALAEAIADPDSRLLVGEIDGVPFGFLLARIERTLPQGQHEKIGTIRLVYTQPDAREVGLAEVMRETVVDDFRSAGISKFDAHVLPGHRLAKNFFEAGGFSARSIIMHHDDHPTDRPGRDPRRL